MNELKERLCLSCEKPVKGRKDKKFCDYHCKNDFHNDLKKISEIYLNKVNLILRHNRDVLSRFCPDGRTLASETEMRRLGFVPEFFTGYYTSKSGGNVYRLCYEFGFRGNPKYPGQFILVRFNFNDPLALIHQNDTKFLIPNFDIKL